jgi:hypothetical protein
MGAPVFSLFCVVAEVAMIHRKIHPNLATKLIYIMKVKVLRHLGFSGYLLEPCIEI